jgi:hypothetical protein
MGPTQPPVQWVPSYFPEVKRPGREVKHSPLSSANVKTEWSYTSTPLYAFMAWAGVTFIETDQSRSPSHKIRGSVIK